MSSSDLFGKVCPDCRGISIYRREIDMVHDIKCGDCGSVFGEDNLGQKRTPMILDREPPIDFNCHKCGKQCDVAPMPPLRAICEDCCEDHEYDYDATERWHLCRHCNRRIDPDWYHCDDDIF